jgi:hypothetical protein
MRRFTDLRNPLLGDIEDMGGHSNKTVDRTLHICPDCGSHLVQPTRWEQAEGDRDSWRVWRRCPECEWTCEGVYNPMTIDAFDEALDIGSHELLNELRSLEHANMREMVDTFLVALRDDLIAADDFAALEYGRP